MTQTPSPKPPPDRKPLGFDDFIGIFVAFTSIGAIFWWSFNQLEGGLDLSLFESLSPSPSPTTTLPPTATESRPTPIDRETTKLSSQSPQLLTPEPSPTSQPSTSVVPVPIPAEQSTSVSTNFTDVPSGFWASPFIAVLAQRGIIEGFTDRTFKPDKPVTRAEFASMIEKAFARSENRQSLSFKDLRSDYWANSAIDRAVQMGFMKGYPQNIFRPDRPIPRVEVLVSLANGLKLATPSSPEQILGYYQDAEQIPRYAIEEVATATRASLVVNYPDLKILKPQQATTRAEAAALIHQALVKSGQVEKISSQYIVQP